MTEFREKTRRPLCRLAAGLLTIAAAALGPAVEAQQTDEMPRGDADRGRVLFTTTYKCYACHGYDAQTGERRLLPMNYTQEAFTTFVRRSPLPQMPAYPDMSSQALADVYAYIRSIPEDAPDVQDLPLLRGIRERKIDALSD
jgi:mono/diheme cytochrome c family protein